MVNCYNELLLGIERDREDSTYQKGFVSVMYLFSLQISLTCLVTLHTLIFLEERSIRFSY